MLLATMVLFDPIKFMSLSGMQLGHYMDRVRSSAFAGIDQVNAARLLQSIETADYEHGLYLIEMGIHFKIQGITDIAIRYLRREAISGGPIITVLKMLCDAHDLEARHIDEIERIPFQKRYIPAYEAFITVLKEQIDILRQKATGSIRGNSKSS